MNSTNNVGNLKSLAEIACIELYLSVDVSQMADKSEQIKKVWSIGQELYFLAERMNRNHLWVAADNHAVTGGLVCMNCGKVKAT